MNRLPTTAILVLFFGQLIAQNSTLSSEALAKKVALYCKGIDLSSIISMSTNRTLYFNSSLNTLQTFANGTMRFLMSSNPGTQFTGILVPLLVPMVLALASLVSLAFMIGVFFPHFCKARKEEVTVSRQRVFFFFTLFFILLLTVSFVFVWFYIIQTIDNVNKTACLYYKAQLELTTGYTTAPYTFMGFDNFNAAVSIFQSELVNFPTLAPSFQQLSQMNFLNLTTTLLPAAKNYSANFSGQQILDTDLSLQIPIIIQSLTNTITRDIGTEINTVVNVCRCLASIASYGISTLQTYGQSINVLIQSLTNTITVVVNQFQTLISVAQPYDTAISYIVSLMDNTKIILVVLMVLTFAFVPYFLSFYYFKNSSDEHDWMVYPAKVINLLLNLLGIIITGIFFVVLFANLTVSSTCYYVNGLMTNQTNFNAYYIQDLQLTNANINATLRYCFNQSTANFVTFLSVSDNNNNATVTASSYPTRKIPVAINRTTPSATTSSSSSASSNITVGSDTSRRLQSLLTLQTDSLGSVSRLLQSSNTSSNGSSNSSSSSSNNFTISNGTIPNPPVGFNLTALLLFEDFIAALNTYNAFYSVNTAPSSPSILSFQTNITKMASGQMNNFVSYDIALSQMNAAIACNDSTVVLNSQSCGSASLYCNVVTQQSVYDFSGRLAMSSCVTDQPTVILNYNNLQQSWRSGLPLYSSMLKQLITNATQNNNTQNSTLPGDLLVNVRGAILNASDIMNNIQSYISSTMQWFNQFGGDLTGITSCYIAKKELGDFEPGLCFLLQTSLTWVTIYLFGVALSIIAIQWGIFYSIKYSGNLVVASWASQTTQGSGWDKSKMTAASFMEQSEIVLQEKSDIHDSDDEKSYFEKQDGAVSEEGSEEDSDKDV